MTKMVDLIREIHFYHHFLSPHKPEPLKTNYRVNKVSEKNRLRFYFYSR